MADADINTDLEDKRLDAKMLIDKTTVIYGATGSGKSTCIIDALWTLREHADQIIVISPTDPSNGTYSASGIVLPPFIHYNLTERLLNSIWNRQEMLASVYKRANNPHVLEALFGRICPPEAAAIVRRAKQSLQEALDDVKEQYMNKDTVAAKSKDIRKKYDEFFLLVYKNYINKYRAELSRAALSEDEAFALKYMNMNPRLILVLDDCAPDIRALRKCPVLFKLFYQNRWAKITLIVSCQSDKDIDPNLRKNVYTSIFTTAGCAQTFFLTTSNGFDRDTQSRARRALNVIDPPDSAGYTRLIYLREKNTFYSYVAELHPDFAIGSPCIHEYCKMITKDGLSMDKSNEFYEYFLK